MDNIIEIKNLNKKYNSFSLENINLEIPKGVIVGLVGENGAGKTTLIKAMLNVINVDSGDVKILNQNVFLNPKVKENVGVVFDDSFLSEYLDLKNISKIMKTIYKNWSDEKFLEMCNRFKLPQDKIINKFSSGMKMKAKIATAFACNSKVLVLDEPTSSLDPIVRNEILDLFQEYIEDGEKSILFSTHITTDLEHVADYIVYIDDGKIILNEEKDKLLEENKILKIEKERFKEIAKEDIIRYKENKYNIEVLVKNNFKYKNEILEKPSIEDIMLFFAKGEK